MRLGSDPARRVLEVRASTVAVLAGTALLTAFTTVTTVTTAPPASAATDDSWLEASEPPVDPPSPSPEQLRGSVTTYVPDDLVRSTKTYTIDGVTTLESTSTEGGDTTISLATDILFEPDRWDVPQAAVDRIAQLVADVPQGEQVEVAGHTDAIVGAVDNQLLSENRAGAVAAVVAAARPDLVLSVAGYADTRPAVTDNPQDAATLAANRRVEITFAG